MCLVSKKSVLSIIFLMTDQTDSILKRKIDRIFDHYDQNKAGTLTLNELHVFLNDLLASTGYSRRVSYEQAYDVLLSIDKNKDGQVNKYEMLQCFKYLTQPNFGGLFSIPKTASSKTHNQKVSSPNKYSYEQSSMHGYILPKPAVSGLPPSPQVRIGTYGAPEVEGVRAYGLPSRPPPRYELPNQPIQGQYQGPSGQHSQTPTLYHDSFGGHTY